MARETWQRLPVGLGLIRTLTIYDYHNHLRISRQRVDHKSVCVCGGLCHISKLYMGRAGAWYRLSIPIWKPECTESSWGSQNPWKRRQTTVAEMRLELWSTVGHGSEIA